MAVHDSRYPVAYDFHDHAYQFEVVGGGTTEIYGLVVFPARWDGSVVKGSGGEAGGSEPDS